MVKRYKDIVFLIVALNYFFPTHGQVAINTDGSTITDPSAMLEIKKGLKSKLKIRSLSYNDTVELQLSNRTSTNAGTDFNFKSIREEGLFISTSSDFPWHTSDSLMAFKPNGSIGIGGQPKNSAALEIKSTTKGLLIPRMTTAQRNSVAGPDVGLLVFDLDKKTLFMHDGVQWLPLAFVNKNAIAPISRFAADAGAENNFGSSVCISGNDAIIGATGENAAYVFTKSGNDWVQQAKLVTLDGEYIGKTVAISGNYAIAGSEGAPIGTNPRQGAAYIFFRSGTTWTQQAKITATDGFYDSYFGNLVGISGDYAIVAAQRVEGAYIFVRSGTTWTQQVKLISTDHTAGDGLGSSIAISGNYAIVGAPTMDEYPRVNNGAAYIFSRSGTVWTQVSKLMHSFRQDNDNFGQVVSISGDFALVTAPKVPNLTNPDAGSAYVYTRSGATWTYYGGMECPDPEVRNFGEYHGFASISGGYVVIMAEGVAYLYKRGSTNWVFVRKIEELFSNYITEVSISGLNIILGTPGNSEIAERAGSVSFLNIE